MRLYFEFFSTMSSDQNAKLLGGPLATSIPVAVINFRHEVVYTARSLARAKYPNIKQWSFYKTGGHFGAMEKPREYAREVEKFLLQL
jgi:pimeloyl-ACP methyl ester carboxylesterase